MSAVSAKKTLVTDRLSVWFAILGALSIVILFVIASVVSPVEETTNRWQNSFAIPASLAAGALLIGFTGVIRKRSHPIALLGIILGGIVSVFSITFFMWGRQLPPPKADQRACSAVRAISAKLATQQATASEVRAMAETASRSSHPEISAAGTYILDPNTTDYRDAVRTIIGHCLDYDPKQQFPGWEDQ